MRYQFLVDTYETERLKVLSVWSMFRDEDFPFRPHPSDRRGRSVHEQMVHQCVSEDLWFRTMLGIESRLSPLPDDETRLQFMSRYADASTVRLDVLRQQPESWWETETSFFDQIRAHAWVVVRRVAHTSHHRGQQMAMLRMLGRDVHSNYGPTSDTGGLMQNDAPVVYAYPDVENCFAARQLAAVRRACQVPETSRPPNVHETLSRRLGDATNVT